jgi:hypothetical protein
LIVGTYFYSKVEIGLIMNRQIRRSILSLSIGLAVVGITSSAPVFAQPMPSQDLVRAIRESVSGAYSKSTYRLGEIDLNGDGTKEAIVYLKGPNCGATHCFYEILQKQNGEYKAIHGALIRIFNPRVAILSSKTKGWNDIAVPNWPTALKQEGWAVVRLEDPQRNVKTDIPGPTTFTANIQPKFVFDFYKMKEFNLADDGVPEVATSQSKGVSKTIQDLPDGNYFYGADPSSYKAGVDYLGFKKAGRTLAGLQYHAGSGRNSCFIGEIQDDKIVNTTEAYIILGNSGILFDRFEPAKRNLNGSITLGFMAFNRGSADALIEIYDAQNHLTDIKIIDGNKPPQGYSKRVQLCSPDILPRSSVDTPLVTLEEI